MSDALTMTAFAVCFIVLHEIWCHFRPSLHEQILRGQVRPKQPLIVKQCGVFSWSVVDADGRVVATCGTPDGARRIAQQLNMIRVAA